jgi:hypothetical protein
MFHTHKIYALRFDIGVMAWPRAVRISVSIKRSIKGNEVHKRREQSDPRLRESREKTCFPTFLVLLSVLSILEPTDMCSVLGFLGTTQFACGFQER